MYVDINEPMAESALRPSSCFPKKFLFSEFCILQKCSSLNDIVTSLMILALDYISVSAYLPSEYTSIYVPAHDTQTQHIM